MENQRLQDIIEQLQKDKLKLEEEKKQPTMAYSSQILSQGPTGSQANSEFYNKQPPSRYSDALDEVSRTNDLETSYFTGKGKTGREMKNSYFMKSDQNKQYWETEGQS